MIFWQCQSHWKAFKKNTINQLKFEIEMLMYVSKKKRIQIIRYKLDQYAVQNKYHLCHSRRKRERRSKKTTVSFREWASHSNWLGIIYRWRLDDPLISSGVVVAQGYAYCSPALVSQVLRLDLRISARKIGANF